MSLFTSRAQPCLLGRLVSTRPLQQVRGKKKMVKVATTLTVRLMKDVPKFGRKGSVVSVSRGRMRNIWYPRGLADYIPLAILKTMPASELGLQERDVNFRPDLEHKEKKITDLELLSPTQTITLLDQFLPPTLQFTRQTTGGNDGAIQGSVTVGDVSSAVRAIMTAAAGNGTKEGEKAGRAVVTSEMVTITGRGRIELEGGKVKSLGEYLVEIQAKGAVQSVKRRVLVVQA